MIDREMFEEWLAHPVTELIHQHYLALAEERKETWMATSWEGGNADPMVLRMLRECSTLLRQMSELKYEDVSDEEDGQSERNSAD